MTKRLSLAPIQTPTRSRMGEKFSVNSDKRRPTINDRRPRPLFPIQPYVAYFCLGSTTERPPTTTSTVTGGSPLSTTTAIPSRPATFSGSTASMATFSGSPSEQR
nr:hypothetical protein Iba_chr01bCG7150 [Ipomoea batatas]GMD33959.1 hypothetical protein Iba_chr09cCG7530 [Ipomoea batatas]GMD67383.1 hypothetical protein Iba_chr12cCG24050 [Ipomoea batatas]GMD96055.1 hypothetical protein Iba_chr15bCG1070 [Ipomoea batatas]